VIGIPVDRETPASVAVVHGDMCRVQIPPLFKDVKTSLIGVHVYIYIYDL